MKVAVIGTGNIGEPLARALAAAEHEVILANSRGPQSLQELAAKVPARAATVEDAMAQAEVVVLSIPFATIAGMAETIRRAPESTIFVDMSNYYGQPVVEGAADAASTTAWLSDQIGRPLVKAWNTIFSRSLALKGRRAGEPDRVALPVAGDDVVAKQVVMQLVEDTGFDAVDAGPLAESWRQEPGSPVYCTDLDAATVKEALERADKARNARDRMTQAQAIYDPETQSMDMVNGVQIYRDITK
ncbi:NADPH-dependent F420 reductase [Cellulomonas sp. ACRRI]|nr:NADPH-dependent F420 reductase [Cellulomonas sp. ACRRI]